MRKVLFVLLGLFLLVMPVVASAATFEAGQKEGNVSVSQTVKNGYFAGNSVNFSGKAEQDLIAAGNTLNFSGTIGSSLIAAGNVVTVSGPVGNSARVAGNMVSLQSSVGSDLMAAGNSVVLGQNATVTDDFLAAGNTVDLLGKVKGNAKLAGALININGEINGDVTINGANKVTVGPNTVISGNLIYKAKEPASIAQGAKILGETKFSKVEAAKTKPFTGKIIGLVTLFSLVMLLATFLTLWLLLYLFPKFMRQLMENGSSKPLANIGLGFVYLVVVPIAAIILMFTVIGLPLGLLTLGIYGIGLGIAKLLTPVFVGSFLFKWFSKNKTYQVSWLTILVGVIVVAIVSAIPFLGPLAIFIVYLLALSQIAQSITNFLKSQR